MVWACFCAALTCFVNLLHHPEVPDPEVPEIASTWRTLLWFAGVMALVLFIAGVYFSFSCKFRKKKG
jgi:Na+/H+ antiporter NhaD/arsenite permease-like protein